MIQAKTIQEPAKIYKDIYRLPLSRFVDAVVDGDLQALVISGEPTEAELLAALENILIEYNDAMASHTPKEMRKVGLIKSVTISEARAAAIDEMIKLLALYRVEKFVKEINRVLQCSLKFDAENPAEYDRDLKRAEMRLKGLRLRANLDTEKLKHFATEEEKKGEVKADRQFFERVLINLADHAKIELSADRITVFQFAERVKRYTAYIEKHNQTSKH